MSSRFENDVQPRVVDEISSLQATQWTSTGGEDLHPGLSTNHTSRANWHNNREDASLADLRARHVKKADHSQGHNSIVTTSS
jgi:hypothetical protein